MTSALTENCMLYFKLSFSVLSATSAWVSRVLPLPKVIVLGL